MAPGAEESVTNPPKLRVFFLPFFASGHMLPMADLAALFALRPDVDPTLCLTPANAAFLRPSLPPSVHLLLYPFPSAAAGLPENQENLSSVSPADEWRIYKAVELSRPAHDLLLRRHRPDAVVADVPFHWTTSIAADLHIPRITWHAVGVFPQLVMNSLHRHRHHLSAAVPDLPGPAVEIPESELPEFIRTEDHLTAVWDTLKEAQMEGHGVVVNTFYEMEPDYCRHYRETDCRSAWFVGPVALASGSDRRRTAVAANDGEKCMSWLDGRAEGSVVFVCFGSWCNFKEDQLREIAVGLEESGCPFLWVVRDNNSGGNDNDNDNSTKKNWMPDGWDKRVEGRGLVMRGWAPQVAILGHKAVGAFLTHCGWNSVLESMAAGVPMLTWPLVFEQFINERLVVEVVGAGERVWDGPRSAREEEKVVVPREAVKKAVPGFMEGKRREAAKTRARERSAMARAAVAEGGSSWNDLNSLIDELIELKDVRLRHAKA